ncbi:pitrilysin family protein [Kineosporia succinea]|uniref:Zn-dependent peptidase n=1 Tax=Kineosporia succinea TaxID=84632 RepID=A0ABT9NXF1_9ACTN|nr:pitrilysin family protein [Kineosporia succinea]MDP9824670.1 putative Zn-dependent peptidase [Kineosporia succinea]
MTAIPLPLVAAGASGSSQIIAGEDGGAIVRRTVLPGGVRVLSEAMPGLRSATIGFWVGVGSRDETTGHHGSTHFLEHLLFKGTARRSAMDIATAFDRVGGESNAVTGKEHTCYYARVLDDDLPMAVDVLCDMVTGAKLDAGDVESERGVILEELAMNDDDPADVVHERFSEIVLGDHPLGRPIGGTADTINAVVRDNIVDHYREHYRAPGLVVTVAGGVDHDRVCELVQASLTRSGWSLDAGQSPFPRRDVSHPPKEDAPAADDGTPHRLIVVNRPTEQANVVVGTTSLVATDPRRYAMSVLNAVLGGGMSSRLFQEIREQRGLAYSVYSFASGYSDSGYFGLYAGCTPARTDEVIALMVAELRRLAADGVPDEELSRAHGQLAGGLVLGLEDTGSRMSRLGKAELVHGEYLGLDRALERIRSVGAQDVQDLAADLASRPLSLSVVGPFAEDRTFRLS